ncbi:MAG TPA: FHA domain-containing protein [Anaerolineales bacterium]|nr:FHA domain-containing protein [Anaerolineales bacterium]
MTTDRLTLSLDIRPNNIGVKQVNVRRSLVVANFVAEIKDKYNLDGNLRIQLGDGGQILDPENPLELTGASEGSLLVCTRIMESTGTLDAIQRGVREPFGDRFQRVYLSEDRTMTEYDLAWQPAIVGRRDYNNPSNNRLLAADLEDIEDLPSVSRHHACVTMEKGSFFVETIQARNPTFLNGARLEQGIKYPLGAGSSIQVGRVTLTFHIIS